MLRGQNAEKMVKRSNKERNIPDDLDNAIIKIRKKKKS